MEKKKIDEIIQHHVQLHLKHPWWWEFYHRTIHWFGLEGTLKPTQRHPLPWAGTPPPSPGCPQPHPAWPWALPGMGQPQLLWAAWAWASPPSEGRISSFAPSLALLPTLLLVQPRVRVAFWAASTHCRLMSSFSSTTTPRSFPPQGVLSVLSLPSLCLCLGLPWPRCWGRDNPTLSLRKSFQ